MTDILVVVNLILTLACLHALYQVGQLLLSICEFVAAIANSDDGQPSGDPKVNAGQTTSTESTQP